MNTTTTIANETFDQERALYGARGLHVHNCRFEGPADGESALKEGQNITAELCFFALRYPFWHVSNASVRECEFTATCRAAFWYDDSIAICDSKILGVKALRECSRMEVENTQIESSEFAWMCRGLRIRGGNLVSEYPFFRSSNLDIRNLDMKGKYSFQYVENGIIEDCIFDTKDAFWHASDLTIRNCTIKGEYLGWYSHNLRFENCRISGTQPFCYADQLVLVDCTMENADLAFEYSDVDARINSGIVSVKNPLSGQISAESIGEKILEGSVRGSCKCKITTTK